MGIRLIWAGIVAATAGIVLGFVKAGECGSVFQPRDSSNDDINAILGGTPPPDCSSALDLTTPVWMLLAASAVLLLAGLVKRRAETHPTTDSQEPSPFG